MDKILINDLLKIPDCDIGKTRLKLNVFNGNTDPLEEYKRDPDKINIEWFLWHNQRRYFHTGQIAICLLYLYDDKWLLTTIKRITKEIDVVDDVGFEAEEIEEYRKYYGRLVLKYHNTKRGMGRTYESMMEELEVIEILSTAYDGDEFPGYENISINKMSYAALETPLPLSMQQKGLSPEGFIPGNCVHEVFGGIHKAQLVAARLPAWR